MASFDDYRNAAEQLRIRREMADAPIAGLIVLALAAGASWAYRRPEAGWWTPALLAALVLGPWALRRALPGLGMAGLRLSILAYPLNILLLAFIAYREFWRLNLPFLEDAPHLSHALEWLAPMIPLVYAYLQLPAWLERIRLLPKARALALRPAEPLALRAVQDLLEATLRGEPSGNWEPAAFRTIPATPSNWRLFLKPDLFRHGAWKVGFADGYALVVFEDGGRVEAVKPGGLRMVAADPEAGAAEVPCLARWNEHLHEGRVDPGSFLRIQGWNAQRPRP
jgi:hypothetical protein